jgi:hypothetical protein
MGTNGPRRYSPPRYTDCVRCSAMQSLSMCRKIVACGSSAGTRTQPVLGAGCDSMGSVMRDPSDPFTEHGEWRGLRAGV